MAVSFQSIPYQFEAARVRITECKLIYYMISLLSVFPFHQLLYSFLWNTRFAPQTAIRQNKLDN